MASQQTIRDPDAKATVTIAAPTFPGRFKADMTVEAYREYWQSTVAAARDTFAELESRRDHPTIENLLKPLDVLVSELNVVPFAFQRCHPLVAMRNEADTAEKASDPLLQDIWRSKGLLKRLVGVDRETLDEQGNRLVERWVRKLERNGAGLDASVRAEIKVKEDKLTVLGQDFGRNIDEGQLHLIVTKDQLAGLPDDFLVNHKTDSEHYKITTDYPDVEAVIKFCTVRATRKSLVELFRSMAYPANGLLLTQIMTLKHEVAKLKGYDDAAEYAVQENTLKSAREVSDFLDRVRKRTMDLGRDQQGLLEAEMVALQQLAPGEKIQGYDRAFTTNAYKQKLGADAKEIRQYFPVKAVVDGVFRLAQTLSDVEFVRIDLPTWHESVTVYDLVGFNGKPIGRLFVDIYPRENKYSHACCSCIHPGSIDGGLPEVQLTANVAGGEGALSSIGEAKTLFHELGHCLHAIMGGQNQQYREFSGYNIEWDLVEAPSQMLEEWLTSKEVLKSFAVNSSGEVIPDHLIDAMVRTDLLGTALTWNTQTFYAKALLECYRDAGKIASGQMAIYDKWDEVEREWHLWDKIPDTHFTDSLGHFPTYGPSYYSYVYSMMIARDLLTAFTTGRGTGLMDLTVARRYKDLVLAPGGSRDGRELVRDFLGREANEEAFGEWLSSGLLSG